MIKWDSFDLLQSTKYVLTKWDSFLVLQRRAGLDRYDNYFYKLEQALQSGATFIVKRRKYYNVKQLFT